MITSRASISRLWAPIAMIWVPALSVCFVPNNLYQLALVRWILGAIFVLFSPGYVLTDVFLLRKGEVSLLDKIVFGVALSVAAIGILGYLLNRLPWGINTGTVLVSLLLVTFGSVLIRIACEKHKGAPLQRERVSMSPRGLRTHHYIALISIMMLGIIVRLIPYMKVRAFLDLDPYNHYMKVNAILERGRTPSFDSLSLAPEGTSVTYTITPLGFEFLVATVKLTTQAPLEELMGLLPVLWGALIILAMFSLCYETTKSANKGVFAAFLTAFPSSWGLIYSVSMNPLAENIGLFLFPLALMYLSKYIRTGNESYVLCSGILFGTMFYVHLFTVIYFLLVLMGYVIISFLANEKRKLTLRAVTYTVAIGSLLSLPVSFQILPVSIYCGYAFSRMASELAFLPGSYLALVPEDLPRILSLPLLWLVAIAVASIVVSTTMATITLKTVNGVLRKDPNGYENYLLAASSCLFLLLAGFASSIQPLRNLFVVLPFSGPFLYTHRVVPYLMLSFYLLVTIAITDHVAILREGFSSRFKIASAVDRLSLVIKSAMLILVVILVPVTSVGYANDLTSWPTPQTYETFFEWVKENTSDSDIFMVNNWDMAMWLRAFANRPTVFSHVHQDLVSKDAQERMLLHTVVFDHVRNHDEAIPLLNAYNVSYVVITSRPVYVDTLGKKWIWAIPDLEHYIEDMDNGGCFKRVFSENGKIWVYSVNRNVTTLLYGPGPTDNV